MNFLYLQEIHLKSKPLGNKMTADYCSLYMFAYCHWHFKYLAPLDKGGHLSVIVHYDSVEILHWGLLWRTLSDQ